MKRYYSFFIIITFLSLSFFSFRVTENKIGTMLEKALDNTSDNNFVVWVYLKDKGPNAMAKLNDPLSIVSQRSLERRSKVKPPGELLDYTDVPLYQIYVNTISANVTKVRHNIKWLNSMSVEVNRDQLNTLSHLDIVKGIELL